VDRRAWRVEENQGLDLVERLENLVMTIWENRYISKTVQNTPSGTIND